MEYDLLNLILESTTKSLFEIKTIKNRPLVGSSPQVTAPLKFSPDPNVAPSPTPAPYKPGGLLAAFSAMNRPAESDSHGIRETSKQISGDSPNFSLNGGKEDSSLLGPASKSRMHKSMDSGNKDSDGEAFNQIISKINHSFQEMNIGRSSGSSLGGSKTNSGNTSLSVNSFSSDISGTEPGPKRPLSSGGTSQGKMTHEYWMSYEAKRLLGESMKNLMITEADISKKDLSYKSHDELTSEKKKVKNELKSYDSLFISHFSRPPSRNEKEPMRPLYVYYKRVKQALVRAKPGTAPGYSGNQASSNQPIRNTISGSRADSQGRGSGGSSGISSGGWVSQNSAGSGDVKGKAIGSSLGVSSSGIGAGRAGASTNPQAIQLRTRLEELNSIRSELRDKLHKYQNDFVQLHSRKIKYHKDLIPIEKEYKLYKQVKIDIQDIETKLEAYK